MLRNKSSGKSNQLLLKLTGNEDVPLSEVLLDPAVMDTLKRSRDPVMNYLFGIEGETTGKLEELLDYALFNCDTDESNNHKLSRVSGTILSSMTEALQERLYNSERMHEKIDEYMESENIRNPLYAGHFSRIFLALSLFSHGEMVSRHPAVLNFLIENIDVIGYMQLLNNLLDGFNNQLIPSGTSVSEVAAKLVDAATTERKALSTFTFFKSFTGDWSLICTEQVVSKLLDFALANDSVIGDLALHATEKILSKCRTAEWVDAVLEEYSTKFTFDGKNPTPRMLAAFPIFVKYAWKDMIDFMFSRDNGNMRSATLFFEALKNMPVDELSEIVDKYRFVERIMENSDCFVINRDDEEVININGFVPELALFLWDNPNLTSASLREDPEWSIFACKYVLPLKMWLNEYEKDIRKVKLQIDSGSHEFD